jgi:hypothetical protein
MADPKTHEQQRRIVEKRHGLISGKDEPHA